MIMSSKKEKLEKLDTLVLDKMIEILDGEDGDLRDMGDLNTAIQYLAKNNVVEDKQRTDSIEEKVAKQLADAKKRRGEGKSK